MIGSVHIMGIVNLTEDSFYAASRADVADVTARVRQMFADGADVVDLGACSTRPGSLQPSMEEEWSRLEPALLSIADEGDGLLRRQIKRPMPPEQAIPFISIDTYRAEIVRRAYEVIGPFMVNDISAGALDPDMLPTVGRLGLPYVAMHMRGTPQTMQQFTDYKDIVEDVKAYFRVFSLRTADAGIREWVLDPGFGFAKTLEQNYELLGRLNELQELGHPILVGVSRKSMIYKLLNISPEESLAATQVVQFAALERGATWLRVHDVPEAVQTARLYESLFAERLGRLSSRSCAACLA